METIGAGVYKPASCARHSADGTRDIDVANDCMAITVIGELALKASSALTSPPRGLSC